MRLIVERLAAGTVFFQAQDSPEEPMLQTRLLREVEMSLNTAELLVANDIDVASVHW